MSYEKINKTKAKKLFNSGQDIYVLPVNVNINCTAFRTYEIINKVNNISFEISIYKIKKSECINSTTGKYLKYYIKT